MQPRARAGRDLQYVHDAQKTVFERQKLKQLKPSVEELNMLK